MTLLNEIERFSPILILYYIVLSVNAKLLFVYAVNWYTNDILKKHVFEKIMGARTYPIIGRGTRPDGAMNCGFRSSGRLATSYGMPSKHAQLTTAFFLDVFFHTRVNKVCAAIVYCRLLYSRVMLGCHTPQQVILGSVFGGSVWYFFYYII